MGCSLKLVDETLKKYFYKLGVHIGKQPWYYMLIPLLVAGLCGTGFQRILYEDDPEYLFSPINGRAKHERKIVEELFPTNYSAKFNPGRATRPGRMGRLIVLARDGGTIMRRHIWNEIMWLDETVRNITIEHHERTFRYADMCAKWGGLCLLNDVLELTDFMEEIETQVTNLNYPIMLNPITFKTYVFPMYFGGMEISELGTIKSVKAVVLSYFIATDTANEHIRGGLWEDKFLATVKYLQLENITVARFASETLPVELERNTQSVLPYFSATVLIMIVFCVITCMMVDCVKSKPMLGLMGVFSAIMGTIAAFGLVMYCGLDFIGINMAAPFLMIGIGIDDTFVMLAAWRRSSVHKSVPERMGNTFSDAAVSITITSLTDMLCFWVGAITPFPCVRIFSVYTGVAVTFTYLWHITFFGGCMAVTGYWEQNNCHSLFPCIIATPRSQASKRNILYRLLCTGGIARSDRYNAQDNKEHGFMMFFKNKVARLLNIPAIKALVVMVFVVYLAVAAWGVTMVREGLERRKLSRYDSYSVTFYDMEDTYFKEYPYRLQVVLSGEYNYSDPEVQQQMEEMLQKLENTSYVGIPLFTESWLRAFLDYVNRNKDYFPINITTEELFIKNLKELYLSGPSVFGLDVKFNNDSTKIVASRFILQTVNITDANTEKEMVAALRQFCDESPLNITVFHPYFIFFDQFLLVLPTSIQCIIIAAVIMMVVSLIFIPNPLCCLWVAFSIVSIEAGVVGYMTLWGVNLDSISMIQLIMCIGFSVDFSAHISYAYMSAKVHTPDERVQECLYALGMPIIQGALSTILGVCALALAPSYIFLTFFKTIFLVIFFGAMHGVFLLPVLLSLFGPGACAKKAEDHQEKPLTHPFFINPPTNPSSMEHKKQLKIPRPQHSGTLDSGHGPTFKNGQFVSGCPPLPALPPPMPTDAAKEAKQPGIRSSVEKDLGIGTSGEDSSESSLSKSLGEKNNDEILGKKKSKCNNTLPIFEVYNNTGYISDDELKDNERNYCRRTRKRQDRSREEQYWRGTTHNDPWEESYYKEQSRYPMKPSVCAEYMHNHMKNLRGDYVSEMKFP